MKILTGEDIKQADQYTIANEPVSSLELMERASEEMAREICGIVSEADSLLFYIGKGNNGGDGLAIARMLANAGFRCAVVMLYPSGELSGNCRFNFERLPENIKVYGPGDDIIDGEEYEIIVDAVLGSGIKGEAQGASAEAIARINGTRSKVISIDIPSGMPTEPPADPSGIVRADITLTIQFPKLSMLLPEAGACCGEIRVVDIGLDGQFIENTETPYYFITQDIILTQLKQRDKFSHKGTYGHALLVCGSYDMMGAALLSVAGALRSGCGLVTAHIPAKQSMALFASAPSAMVSADKGKYFTSLPTGMEKYTVCGAGPGLGQHDETVKALTRLLHAYDKPMVLDADALNILASNMELMQYIPSGSVLTPHPGEFERLAGKWETETEKLEKLRGLAAKLDSTVVLKGANTAVCTPAGRIYFNPTGTPGMAKGGSGDVLTGFITGLMARGYNCTVAAVLGVYLHGAGGEKAAEYYGQEAMNSSDLPDFIAEAYRELESPAE